MVSITITDPLLSDLSKCMFVGKETNYNNDRNNPMDLNKYPRICLV
jgi:hypothetical protein